MRPGRTAVLVAALAVFVPAVRHAACGEYRFLSPGIKISRTLGGRGGLTFGAELSYIWYYHQRTPNAIVAVYDFNRQYRKLHLGYQVSSLAGGEAGPTLIVHDGKKYAGFGVTPFVGGPVLFASFTHTTAFALDHPIADIGIVVKAPIALADRYEIGFGD